MVIRFIKTVISGIFSILKILVTHCHFSRLGLWHMVCFSGTATTGLLSATKPGCRRAVPQTDGVAQTPNAHYFFRSTPSAWKMN